MGINIRLIISAMVLFLFSQKICLAQNPKIKCYFNHPVNNNVATIEQAKYLNGTFPDTIAAYINRAQYSIDVAIYNYTSFNGDSVAKIASAINNAYQRGVVIRWIRDGSSSNTGLSLVNSNIQKIASPTTGGYGIMHNKFIVIDANAADTNLPIVVSGSYNWSVQQTNGDYNNLIIVQNKEVALAYYNEFNKMWGDTAAIPNLTNSTFGTHKTISTKNIFNVNGTKVEVYFSPKDTVGKRLQTTINSADSELFFGIYTFTDNTISGLIKNKADSGLLVKGIVDKFSQSYSSYTNLKTALGANLILYKSNNIYHNKIMLVDAFHPNSDPQTFTGSFNWSGAAQNSNDENAMIIHDASIANQYYQSLCQDFSNLGGSACISTLPIDLYYFNAELQGKVVLIKWATEANTDINNLYEIERSTDGITFNKLEILTKKIGSRNIYYYESYDKSIDFPVVYYRLKWIDENNNATFSNVVKVMENIKNQQQTILYPNPVTNHFTLSIKNPQTVITILNSLGQVVKTQLFKESGKSDIDVHQLVNGVYELILKDNTTISHQTFIKN